MLQTADFIKMLFLSFWLTMARVINVQLKTAYFFQIMVAYFFDTNVYYVRHTITQRIQTHNRIVVYVYVWACRCVCVCTMDCVTVEFWCFVVGMEKKHAYTAYMYRHAAL